MPWTKNAGIEFDARDAELLSKRIAARAQLPRPAVGDFVEFSDGVVHRISSDWVEYDGTVQTSKAGSFYLDRAGRGDFSGGLDPGIPLTTLTDTGEIRDGDFWFFHNDLPGAHRGVGVEAPCKVYRSALPSDWWHLARRDEFAEFVTF